jgi:hypothetical protein
VSEAAKLALVTRVALVLAMLAGASSLFLAMQLRVDPAAARTTLRGLPCELPGLKSWAIKTLSDPEARSVDMTPQVTTVAALRARRRPAGWDIADRVHGIGTVVFRVTADLVGAQHMHDHDIHLVIADPATHGTMIVEFPDVRCWGAATSFARPQMERARAEFVAACGTVGNHFQRLRGVASITGVGFFDRFHESHVIGTADNAIELHPALDFHAASCVQV